MKSILFLLGVLGLVKLNHRLNLAISYMELFITCSFIQETKERNVKVINAKEWICPTSPKPPFCLLSTGFPDVV